MTEIARGELRGLSLVAGGDLSDVGAELPTVIKPGPLAIDEDKLFDLERVREDHDHERKRTSQNLGSIGNFFGSRENAITYIVAVFALFCMLVVAGFSYGDADLKKVAVEFFKAVGFACVGFITGKSIEKKE